MIWYRLIKNKYPENHWAHFYIKKLFRYFTFGTYIRFVYQVFILLLLTSVSEIYTFNGSNEQRRRSLPTAWLIVAFIVAFACVWVWQYVKSLNEANLSTMCYFIEFFSGIKPSKAARLHAIMFFVRRTALWLTLILLKNVMSLTLLNSLFVLFQFCYLWFSVFARPFIEQKDNISEILNEIMYTVLWSLLIFFKSEQDWSKTFEGIYISLIVFNNIAFSLISMVKRWMLCL